MTTPKSSLNCKRLLLTLSVGTALAITSAPAQAATPPVTVTCGEILTQSVKVANDLTDCPGDGLVIGADNVTVDLNGHTIDGVVNEATDCDTTGAAPTGVGIQNAAGHDGVSIGGGAVQQFADGFRGGSETAAMSDSRLHHLTVRNNRDAGLAIGRTSEGPGPPPPVGSDNRVEHNVVVDNNRCGWGLGISLTTSRTHVAHNRVEGSIIGIIVCCDGTDRNVIERNSVSRTRDFGIFAVGNGSDNVIRRNSVSRSGDHGIRVLGQSGAVVQGNLVFENEFGGIVLTGVSASEVSDNRVLRNGDNVIVSGSRNRITSNKVTDAVGCEEEPGVLACGYGISVEDGEGHLITRNRVARALKDTIRLASFDPENNPTVGAVVRRNRVRGAGLDGISVGSEEDGGTVTDTLLLGNRAVGSGDDGIDVEDAATTLTRNRALHNHDLGIEAVPGVTDGGGNKAAGNGNPLQCTNVFCS